MTIKKVIQQNTLIVLSIIWIIFSVSYIIRDQWQDFKVQYAQSAYQKGVSDSVRTLMFQAEKCTIIPLFDGDKKIEVINITCLQNSEQNQSNE